MDGKKKKSNDNETVVQRPTSSPAGEVLRAARIKKNISLEEISSAINVRVGQLRAIEEGDLDALPGMTYAMGFVKSYAGYLKLNGPELARQFKADHGVAPVAPEQKAHMPEPLPEDGGPNFFVLGVFAFCIVLGLAGWAVFSGGEEDSAAKQAEHVPQAPAVGTVTGISKTAGPVAVVTDAAPPPGPLAPAEEKKPAEEETAAVAEAPPSPTPPAGQQTSAPAPEAAAAAAPVSATATVPAAPVVLPFKPDRDRPGWGTAAAAPDGQTPANPINIKGGRSRVTLSAKTSAWVSITSRKNGQVLDKVLRPGDQYFVPDEEGLRLTTSNAGGLVITVDGTEVQSLGQRGEIVSGVDLSADDLKTTRTKVMRRGD